MRLFALSFAQGLPDVSPPWRFDPLSALIGAAVTLLLVGLLYAFRDALSRAWEAILASLRRLWRYLLAGAEESYREQVVAWARSLIIPAHAASPDAIFIEPELHAPPPVPRSISEVEARAEPFLLPLHRILGGHSRLIVLGAPGTGRTILLAYLALACARMEESESTPHAIQGRLPLYVALPMLAWDAPEVEKKKDDGMAKLIGAAVTAVGGGSGLAAPLRKCLESGKVIVLADGWDELSPPQRQQAIVWLTELIGAFPDNLWLVAAGMRDYALLTEAGFVPLTLADWHTRQAEMLAQHWLEVYTPEGESPPVPPRELLASLQRAVRLGYSPLELSLLAFVHLTDRRPPTKGRTALFDRALELLLQSQGRTQEEPPTLLVACRAALGHVALTMRLENRAAAGREEIEAAIEAALPPPEERPARAVARVFRMLAGEGGLLRRAGADQYVFIHPLWQAYLAARQLVALSPASLIERLEDPRWTDVLRFYAELGDMRPLVAAWLRTPDDMFYTRLCALGAWVGAAPEGAAWRDGAMAVLARTLVQPGRFPTRRALAEALATSGVSGVTYFLKQALQHPNADVRIAAITGLARVADEADIPMFEAALRDTVPAVREAAVRALASLANDAAIRLLEQALLEGDDALRLTAAEMLAKGGDEGVAFLHEMIASEDVVVRRAAVIGLGLVGARDTLERVARADEQWIVRSAAEAAIDELEKRKEISGIAAPPQVEQLSWLITWAASRGEGVGLGEAARLMLRRALSEGDAPVRLAAAQTLAQVGRPDDVNSLRAALADPDRDIANAAFVALAEISRRYDLRITP